jgi:hypothetical protein
LLEFDAIYPLVHSMSDVITMIPWIQYKVTVLTCKP